jgi:type II secretory pathway pseudopilin PulG
MELIIVIAVIAVISGAMVWRFYGIAEAARHEADVRNVQMWNMAYSSVVSSGYVTPDGKPFSELNRSDASSRLAAGVRIIEDADSIVSAPIPSFSNSEINDTFEPGTGFTWGH